MEERNVLITPDGFGRIAIVRRPDGMFCLYEHWRQSVDMQEAMKVQPVEDRRWTDADYDRNALYDNVDPLPGLFASVGEAEREARGKEAFREAVPETAAQVSSPPRSDVQSAEAAAEAAPRDTKSAGTALQENRFRPEA